MSNERADGDEGTADGGVEESGNDASVVVTPKMVRSMSEDAFKEFGDASRMDDFEEVKELGRGGFGVVTLVRRKEDGKKLVIKKLEFNVMGKEDVRDAMNEVKVGMCNRL